MPFQHRKGLFGSGHMKLCLQASADFFLRAGCLQCLENFIANRQ